MFLYLSAGISCASATRYTCLDALQSERLSAVIASGKSPRGIVHYPSDFKPGQLRKVIVYFHGFGMGPESYENFAKAKLEENYAALGLPQPVVLSFSMGTMTVAGVDEHGLGHPAFLPARDYWIALRKYLPELDFEIDDISFLANSGGAFSAFQMLRNIPPDIKIKRAVFFSFPNFIEGGLGPNPSLNGLRDEKGTALRKNFDTTISQLARDKYFDRLIPSAALEDGTFPKDVEILIQAAEWDAFGYTALNVSFANQARALGYPVTLKILPNQGHADEYDNAGFYRFFAYGADDPE